jgi:hypothetical protein
MARSKRKALAGCEPRFALLAPRQLAAKLAARKDLTVAKLAAAVRAHATLARNAGLLERALKVVEDSSRFPEYERRVVLAALTSALSVVVAGTFRAGGAEEEAMMDGALRLPECLAYGQPVYAVAAQLYRNANRPVPANILQLEAEDADAVAVACILADLPFSAV